MNVIYPGSFDPVTNGHVDIARRSANILGQVTVAVLDNPVKTSLFSVKERVNMLREVFCEDENIEVESFCGLLAEFVKLKRISTIIRGVRSTEDLSKEMPYAVWNRQLSSAETVFLTAEPSLMHISSSVVREVAAHVYKSGLDDIEISQSVPPIVREALREKYYR